VVEINVGKFQFLIGRLKTNDAIENIKGPTPVSIPHR